MLDRAEVQAKYQFSEQLLDEYEACRQSQQPDWSADYSSVDLVELREMANLIQIGFSLAELAPYLKLPTVKKIKRLTQKRRATLITIHQEEKQIAMIDYLRFQLATDN